VVNIFLDADQLNAPFFFQFRARSKLNSQGGRARHFCLQEVFQGDDVTDQIFSNSEACSVAGSTEEGSCRKFKMSAENARIVLIPVDDSKHAENAFDCKLMNCTFFVVTVS